MTGRILDPTGDATKVLFKTDEDDTFIVKISDNVCAAWGLLNAESQFEAAESIAMNLPSSKMLPNEESPDGDPIYCFTTDNGFAYETLEATLENL